MKKSLTISKLDAAKRQLETVIRLYFSNGDPVSIHTLTAAAYNIIRDVNIKRGGGPMLVKDQMFDYVKPEYKEILKQKLSEAENFFKHADRDHEATLKFNLVQTEIQILDACSQYYKLTSEFPPLFQIYQGWYMANNLEMFNFQEEHALILGSTAPDFISMGRQGYFNFVLPLVMGIRT